MGKSPGKWIKMLFGKKSRSHTSKKAANDKDWVEGKAAPAMVVGSPVISHPLPINTTNPEAERGTLPTSATDGTAVLAVNHHVTQEHIESGENDLEKAKLEQAASKVQAAFRGYLARRAFHALRGIIRLQALIRGHLVRRQAVATLRCTQGVVKFQALVRGRKVRLSGIGFEVQTKFSKAQIVDVKHLNIVCTNVLSQETSLAAHPFVRKLVSPRPVAMPLLMQYAQGESNSVWNWMERWTSLQFWKQLPQPKKTVDMKSQVKRGGYTMETESGRSKRSIRRNFSANTDSGSIKVTSESEKSKRNPRKSSSSAIDPVHEHPQSELEKVKRNLRKISNSVAQASDQTVGEKEKLKRSVRRASSASADVIEHDVADSGEKMKRDPPAQEARTNMEIASEPDQEVKANMDIASKAVGVNGAVDMSNEDNRDDESYPLQGIGQDENHPPLNGESDSKEEQPCLENQKTSKRRASFTSKPECPENGLQNTPTLPSYMAATESAKAKLRGQGSARFTSDGIDKNGFTRRHSLPSSINGKLTSLSPRTQRLVQTSGKGGIRSDRSFSSSRDGNDKPIQVEWRR